jgi:hypothetical protein
MQQTGRPQMPRNRFNFREFRHAQDISRPPARRKLPQPGTIDRKSLFRRLEHRLHDLGFGGKPESELKLRSILHNSSTANFKLAQLCLRINHHQLHIRPFAEDFDMDGYPTLSSRLPTLAVFKDDPPKKRHPRVPLF